MWFTDMEDFPSYSLHVYTKSSSTNIGYNICQSESWTRTYRAPLYWVKLSRRKREWIGHILRKPSNNITRQGPPPHLHPPTPPPPTPHPTPTKKKMNETPQTYRRSVGKDIFLGWKDTEGHQDARGAEKND